MQTLHENDTTPLSISQLNNDNPNIRAALLMHHFRQNRSSPEISSKQTGYQYFRYIVGSISVGKDMLDKTTSTGDSNPPSKKHTRSTPTNQPAQQTSTENSNKATDTQPSHSFQTNSSNTSHDAAKPPPRQKTSPRELKLSKMSSAFTNSDSRFSSA